MSDYFFAPLEFDAGEFQIRTYRQGDGAAFFKAVNDSREHLKPWMEVGESSLEDSEAAVRRFYAAYLRNEEYLLGLWQGADLIGSTGFHLRVGPAGWGTAVIGMWIAAAYAGKGLGTRALKALTQWGFTEWPWEKLVWRCDVDNHVSAHVAEKAGYKFEGLHRQDMYGVDGTRRDMRYYAALKSEWGTASSAG